MLWSIALASAADLTFDDGSDASWVDSSRDEAGDEIGLHERQDAAAPEVVGGRPVKQGRWDDAVGVEFYGNSWTGCTGTLVGPRAVLTAGHCAEGITGVLVGSKDSYSGQGRIYPIERIFEYPNSQRTFDATLILLAEPVKDVEPRTIGMECITDRYLKKGAPVQIVGFGLTSESGTGYNSYMNEARSSVTSPGCKEDIINGVFAGCNEPARPNGEVAAGGDGIDACFGDSGGPLYLLTDEGDFVIGITSRSFLGVNPNFPCRDGGIWVRPDAIIDWILDKAGSNHEISMPTCNDAPTAEADAIVVHGKHTGTGELRIADPDGDATQAVIEITTPPAHGTATIEGTTVTYTAEDGFEGDDSIGLTVTDAGTDYVHTGAPVSTTLTVPVTVKRGLALGCDSTGGGAALGFGLLVVAGLARRRR